METIDFSWILKVWKDISENDQIWNGRLFGRISTDMNLGFKNIQLSL